MVDTGILVEERANGKGKKIKENRDKIGRTRYKPNGQQRFIMTFSRRV